MSEPIKSQHELSVLEKKKAKNRRKRMQQGHVVRDKGGNVKLSQFGC